MYRQISEDGCSVPVRVGQLEHLRKLKELGYIKTPAVIVGGWALAFAPSAKGLHLQQLLDVCSKYVSSHNVVFNVTKSQCLITKSRNDIISRPMFRVCGASLPYTDSNKYLGHIMNSDLTDDADMMR